ncbi:MAG: hypothetical protein C4B58_14070 [Deltaproteobacteria bacterium]|nr:MAG: hypothetical protein C4B58_14070 [Deltaproteobacteria bacterium]
MPLGSYIMLKIAAVEWKEKPLDYEKKKVSFLLEGTECNISHGDRLSPGDKKRIAREIGHFRSGM